jgi:hypothetical protein
MKRTALLLFAVFLPVIAFAQPANWQALASRILGGLEERRLRHLEQEWQVEETEPNLLKMTHKMTGMVKYVDITNHTVDFNKLAANPNVQVIDLINVDTTLYNWKYRRKNMFPIGSGNGYPMTIGDFNSNGKLDLAGSYKPVQNIEFVDCAIAELQADSVFTIQKVYLDSTQIVLQCTDVDLDGLLELNLKRNAQHFANYEQTHPDSFPDSLMFLHRMWEFGGQVASETFTDLDSDNYTDVLYVGTDSTQQCCHQVFVAEYDISTGVFQRRFGVIPSPDWIVSGFSVGDFDGDGFKEFATGSGAAFSHVYIWENTGNDSYTQVYVDTLTTGNAYMTASSNDIDGNGKIEFFVGGSSFYNGVTASRVYWFEADGNNQYTKVRSIFMLGTDVLGFTELYSYDVNDDGVDDLVFSFSFKIVMLVWNPSTQQFDLYYVDEWENYDQEINSINMYDVFNSGALELFVNIVDVVTAPRIRTYLYRPNTIVGIPDDENPVIDNFTLEQNYPNPFNGSTTIRFRLPTRNRVILTIYDLTGKEVMRLINDQFYAPGDHTINWNGLTQTGKEVSSGIYLYVLQAGSRREVRKMLLIK